VLPPPLLLLPAPPLLPLPAPPLDDELPWPPPLLDEPA
jgi:hypothetical protein